MLVGLEGQAVGTRYPVKKSSGALRAGELEAGAGIRASFGVEEGVWVGGCPQRKRWGLWRGRATFSEALVSELGKVKLAFVLNMAVVSFGFSDFRFMGGRTEEKYTSRILWHLLGASLWLIYGNRFKAPGNYSASFSVL